MPYALPEIENYKHRLTQVLKILFHPKTTMPIPPQNNVIGL